MAISALGGLCKALQPCITPGLVRALLAYIEGTEGATLAPCGYIAPASMQG